MVTRALGARAGKDQLRAFKASCDVMSLADGRQQRWEQARQTGRANGVFLFRSLERHVFVF